MPFSVPLTPFFVRRVYHAAQLYQVFGNWACEIFLAAPRWPRMSAMAPAVIKVSPRLIWSSMSRVAMSLSITARAAP